MRLSGLQLSETGGEFQISATVTWEEAPHPPAQLCVRAASIDRSALTVDYDTFAAACALPAMHYGERRLVVEGDLCPRLCEGLETLMQVHQTWEPKVRPIPIEPRDGFQIRYPGPCAAGMFQSGGIDSMTTLRRNRLHFPAGHPESIRYAFLVEGYDIGGFGGESNNHYFLRARQSLETVCAAVRIHPIPVTTNFLCLDPRSLIWARYWHASALLAVAHLFGNALDRIYLGSSYDARHLIPWGSHPLTDPLLSSSRLQVRHDGWHLSRLQKTRIVAGWQTGVDHLRVCLENPSTGLNCGRCEKCVRTRLGLLVCGVSSAAFPSGEIKLPEPFSLKGLYHRECYSELIEPVRAIGRDDLAEVFRAAIHDFDTGNTESDLLRRQIAAHVPEHSSYILVGRTQMDPAVLPPLRTPLPFLCKHGQDWGPPTDDDVAIAELESMREAGVAAIVFPRVAMWWLEHYRGFATYLRSAFPCPVDRPEVVIFTCGKGQRD